MGSIECIVLCLSSILSCSSEQNRTTSVPAETQQQQYFLPHPLYCPRQLQATTAPSRYCPCQNRAQPPPQPTAGCALVRSQVHGATPNRQGRRRLVRGTELGDGVSPVGGGRRRHSPEIETWRRRSRLCRHDLTYHDAHLCHSHRKGPSSLSISAGGGGRTGPPSCVTHACAHESVILSEGLSVHLHRLIHKDARRAAPHGRTPLPRSLSASTAWTTIRCYSSSAPLSLKKKRLGGDGNRGLREGIWMAGRTPKVWMTSYSSSGGDPVVGGARAGGASLHNPRRPQLGAGQSAWPDLPPELLESILLRLVPIDRVAVRLVCSSWRSCARASISADLPFEAPRLLLRRPGSCGSLAFFSLRRLEILPFALPDRLNAGRCCGQIGGWLAMAFDEERAIELRNLFSGESVAMPRPPAFPVAKIVLSAPPTSLGWVAAVLDSSGTLALLQPDVSGGAWITIAAGEKHGGFRDVAFWRRRLCALGLDGTVLAYRADLRARVAAVSELREKDSQRQRQVYLVESEGELLLVSKLYRVMGVKVCRFRPEESKWEEVTELPGKAVFVGTVASVAVLATAALPGIRANCVYFAQRNVDTILPHAIGVCPLGDQETAVVAIAGGHSVDVEPVWIIPSVA